MDPIIVIAVIDLTYKYVVLAYKYAVIARFTYPAWEGLTLHRLRKNNGSLHPKFGMLQALALITIFPDAKQIVDRVEKYVLGAKTDEVMVLRKSRSEDRTMLAVAACLEISPNQFQTLKGVSNVLTGCYCGASCHHSLST